jgi:hypothetical protein
MKFTVNVIALAFTAAVLGAPVAKVSPKVALNARQSGWGVGFKAD